MHVLTLDLINASIKKFKAEIQEIANSGERFELISVKINITEFGETRVQRCPGKYATSI